MEVFPFHHRNLFFHILTDLDLSFKELREILDYLLENEGFQGEEGRTQGGRLYEVQLGEVHYDVDVHGYEVVIYRRTERPGWRKEGDG